MPYIVLIAILLHSGVALEGTLCYNEGMFAFIDMIIVRPIANILFLIYGLVGDFGLAIILFTVLVKICLWPLAKRQLHQTRLMRKIQPELAEIKKNCNGNRQLESLQMLDLYKRNNIKPFRSMLTLIIQLPIFIALYTAVRVMVLPTPSDNLSLRVYAPIAQMERVEEVAKLQQPYIDYQKQVAEIRNDGSLNDEEKTAKINDLAAVTYDFHPTLFGVVDLDVKAGFGSVSALIILAFALASAFSQYWISRQQLPTKKQNRKTFRQIMREAADGKEPDQSELNQIVSGQMSYMMPVMMLLLMINLPGALVFYYLISNLMTGVQQRYILNKNEEAMEISADKKILRELKKVEEGQIVKDAPNNHWMQSKNAAKSESKTGVNITHVSAKSRKSHKKKRS